MDTELVSLKGGLLMKVGESGFEEGSGDSGGPMLMSSSGRRWPRRDLVGDILGELEMGKVLELGSCMEIGLGLH